MDTTTERPGLMELASQGLENTVSEAIREEFISRKSRYPIGLETMGGHHKALTWLQAPNPAPVALFSWPTAPFFP